MDGLHLPASVGDAMMKKHNRYHDVFDGREELNSQIEDLIHKLGMPGLSFASYSGAKYMLGNYSVFRTILHLNKMGMTLQELYSLNSFGFRSDEFSSEHAGKHILFAGCSTTFGDSMYLDKTWAHKVYSKIAESSRVSGYYNVGLPGASIVDITDMIREYISRYGEPDHLFVLLPDNRDNWVGPPMFAELIRSLSHCKTHIASWDRDFSIEYDRGNTDVRNLIPGIMKFKNDDMLRHVYNFVTQYPDEPLGYKAMDDSHPGIPEHEFYAKLFLKHYRSS